MKVSRKNTFLCFLMLSAVILFTFGCGSAKVPQPNTETPSPSQPNNAGPTTPQPAEEPPKEEKEKFTVFFGDKEAMFLVPEQREVVKGTSKLPELMVQELIKGPQESGHTMTVPKETKLLSLDIADKIATVNLSKEIQTKHWGGSTGEIMTIYSIVNTLTQLPEIEAVQFLIEGEKQEAIWGNTETGSPIRPDDGLIKK